VRTKDLMTFAGLWSSSGERLQFKALVTEPEFGGSKLNDPETIYLDFAAATPVCDEALAEMLIWHNKAFANPANRLHGPGEFAEHGLWDARERLAHALSCEPTEIVFCSSATEANNLALRGLALHPRRRRNRMVVSPSEHSSVLETAQALKRLPLSHPLSLETLRLDPDGQVDLDHARSIIDEDTLFVSVMNVNNETGVRQTQLNDITQIAHAAGALVHCDAVQGFARDGFSFSSSDADLAVVSSSKIYGPKGAAALLLRSGRKLRLAAQLTGGGQESGLRSSTPNLPAIRGFARAAELMSQMHANGAIAEQQKHLEKTFLNALSSQTTFTLHGSRYKAPGTLMLSFPNVNAMKLIEDCRILCISTGSACRTFQATASPVLLAMGVPLEQALSSIRVSFGIPTQEADVLRSAEIIGGAVARQK
jgi:cysteine desulfurase